MEDQIINFETAKLASEVGLTRNGIILKNNTFVSKGITCSTCYNENGKLITPKYILEKHLVAPTQSLLQKWIREKHNLNVCVLPFYGLVECIKEINEGVKKEKKKLFAAMIWENTEIVTEEYETYEDALEAGLQEALKLI